MDREIRLTKGKDPADVLDYKEPITKIYLVRHGETKANVHNLLFGHLDWDLNKTGRQQAEKTAKKLQLLTKKGDIKCIITSPLRRAKSTSKIIGKKLKIKKIIINKDLIEKSEGVWEGMNYWQARKQDPINYKRWIKNPFYIRPPKGESIEELRIRVNRFYKNILKKYPGQSIIVVSHSGPIKMLVLIALKMHITKFWYLKAECASITELHLSKKHAMLWGLNK